MTEQRGHRKRSTAGGANETRDSIKDIWGPRTPHDGEWPVRIDERTLGEPERWVSSVCVLCSTGCGMDIGVAEERIFGVRGRATDRFAPDALAIPLDVGGQAKISLPKRIRAISSIPDTAWVPMVSALLVLFVGLLGLALGRPWLGPSLGPTIILVAMSPAHPTARGWNILAGHLVGLAAGIAAVLLVGAQAAPNPLASGELTAVRVAAATLAILLTAFGMILLRASHPPAAATTLLVALGAIWTSQQVLATIIGVLIVAVAGELVRRYRLDRATPAERMALHASIARAKLRGV